jgi:hypothetical protein
MKQKNLLSQTFDSFQCKDDKMFSCSPSLLGAKTRVSRRSRSRWSQKSQSSLKACCSGGRIAIFDGSPSLFSFSPILKLTFYQLLPATTFDGCKSGSEGSNDDGWTSKVDLLHFQHIESDGLINRPQTFIAQNCLSS